MYYYSFDINIRWIVKWIYFNINIFDWRSSIYDDLTKPEFTNCPQDATLLCPAEVNVIKRKGGRSFQHLFHRCSYNKHSRQQHAIHWANIENGGTENLKVRPVL